MLRSAGFALAWLGLSAMTMGLSLAACYGDATEDKKGICEDDGNPCTEDTCTSGKTDHRPKNDGEGCTLGSNTGTCQKGDCTLACGHEGEPDCACVSDLDCPLDTECSDWSCDTDSGKCVNAMTPDDTEVGTQVPGDCQRVQCRAGVVDPRPDPNDLPSNVVGDCKQYYCDNITPKTMNDPTDTPTDNPGDCKKYVCVDEKAVEMPDDADKPAPTDCVTNNCVGGVVTPVKDPAGTLCMNKTRACNSAGECADCLSTIEIGACNTLNLGNCPVKLCNGQSCAAGGQSACQSNFCSDEGNLTKICCNESCTGECRGCNVPGSVGQCTNIPYYQNDGSYTNPTSMVPGVTCDINNGAVCNGMADCRKIVEKTCAINADCISNMCSTTTPKFCLGAKGEPCSDGSVCASGTCDANGACT